MSTVIGLISTSDKLKVFSDALKSAQMLDLLEGEGPFTVFAPTDPAIAQAPAGRFKKIQGDDTKLHIFVKYHVVMGYYDSKKLAEILKGNSQVDLEALCGYSLAIKSSGFFRSHTRVNDATIVTADLKAENGVVHTIDTVLFPPEKA